MCSPSGGAVIKSSGGQAIAPRRQLVITPGTVHSFCNKLSPEKLPAENPRIATVCSKARPSKQPRYRPAPHPLSRSTTKLNESAHKTCGSLRWKGAMWQDLKTLSAIALRNCSGRELCRSRSSSNCSHTAALSVAK